MHSGVTRWIGTESLLVNGLRWRIEPRRIPCAYWIPSLAQRCIVNWLGSVVMLRYQCTLNGVVQASTFLRHAHELDEYTFQMVTKIILSFEDCYCVENAGVYPWKLSVETLVVYSAAFLHIHWVRIFSNINLIFQRKFTPDVLHFKCRHSIFIIALFCGNHIMNSQWTSSIYRQVYNIRRTLVGNNIVDHSDVVGASPAGAAPTTFSFST